MAPKSITPKFSSQTLSFIKKAARQKHPEWLEKNFGEYEKHLLNPLKHLAQNLKAELGPLAPDYSFPQKGIGRLKRSAHSVKEYGGGLYKSWMTYSASKPRTSRFETNPNIFFLINTEDLKDPVLIAGGLYMPSSTQTRMLRETIAQDTTAFEKLFTSKDFSKCFSGGFSDEKISTRTPRGFDPNHPKLNWLRLQAFFVWRRYSMKEFSSRDFAKLVTRDGKQILRLNRLLEAALQGPTRKMPAPPATSPDLLSRLNELDQFVPHADF